MANEWTLYDEYVTQVHEAAESAYIEFSDSPDRLAKAVSRAVESAWLAVFGEENSTPGRVINHRYSERDLHEWVGGHR